MKAKCALLFFALVAAAASSAGAQSAPDCDEIVVLGQKLKDVKVRGKVHKENGIRTLSFRIVKSTGDPDVDNIVLQASNECGSQLLPQIGKVNSAAFNKEWNECVKRRAGVLVEELHDRRSDAGAVP